MRLEDVEKIVTDAVKSSRVVEVDYVRKVDGARVSRLMEPLDVSAGARSKTGEKAFWGWCLAHDRIERRAIPNIISMRLTDRHFDLKGRERVISQYKLSSSKSGKQRNLF